MVKSYEIMTITKVSLGDQVAKDVSKKVNDLITTLGGEIVKEDFWGKRKFAYAIEHETEGFYNVVNFKLDSLKLKDLKTKLNLMTELVRYLVTARKAE